MTDGCCRGCPDRMVTAEYSCRSECLMWQEHERQKLKRYEEVRQRTMAKPSSAAVEKAVARLDKIRKYRGGKL